MLTRRKFVKDGILSAAVLSTSSHWLGSAFAAPIVELTAKTSKQKLYTPDSAASDLWTYNGTCPGPVLRAKKGEVLRVQFKNQLDVPSSIHWHGIRIDNKMDGVSGLTQDPVQPGDEFLYQFRVPDAGTYWYHAHNNSWNQVARGLYGPLIIEEPESDFDAAHDLTLMLDDWRLNDEGSLDLDSLGSLMDWSHGGRMGNWMTVNGRSQPSISLNGGENYRLRLVNASNSRILNIQHNQPDASILAFDGRTLASSKIAGDIPIALGPAQRVDLHIVPKSDFSLEEVSSEPFAAVDFTIHGKAVNGSLRPRMSLPADNLPEPQLPAARQIKIEMTGGAMGRMGTIRYQGKELSGSDFRTTKQVWAFNQVANLPKEPLFSAFLGETIILETINQTAWPHAMHLHGYHFKILEKSGEPIDDEQLWRDTFLLEPDQTVRVAFVADNKGKWLYHCHMLEHAAAGMQTWFQVD
jgi:FtsP/CotA-like multicopper oxidase with cupredoxin domain